MENTFSIHATKTFDDVAFVEVDRESAAEVKELLERQDYDLVVHTAGPFQEPHLVSQ